MKPIVHYRPSDEDRIEEGVSAVLMRGTVDHPKLSNSGCPVITSRVLRIEGGSARNAPIFETENTWYGPPNANA